MFRSTVAHTQPVTDKHHPHALCCRCGLDKQGAYVMIQCLMIKTQVTLEDWEMVVSSECRDPTLRPRVSRMSCSDSTEALPVKQSNLPDRPILCVQVWSERQGAAATPNEQLGFGSCLALECYVSPCLAQQNFQVVIFPWIPSTSTVDRRVSLSRWFKVDRPAIAIARCLR